MKARWWRYKETVEILCKPRTITPIDHARLEAQSDVYDRPILEEMLLIFEDTVFMEHQSFDGVVLVALWNNKTADLP